MKYYVAGSYQHRNAIAELVDKIQQTLPTFECTSTWIRQGEEDDLLKEKGHQHFIDLDREDIARADVFLLINDSHLSKHSTGKWVELGIALELELQIVVWGTLQDSLFVHGKNTIHIESTDYKDLIAALSIVEKVMNKQETDIQDAYRAVTAAENRGIGGELARALRQGGSQELRAGVRDGEGGALHDLDRAFASRAQRISRAQIRAGEATAPVDPASHRPSHLS